VLLAIKTAVDEVGHVPGLLPDDEREAVRAAIAEAEGAMQQAPQAEGREDGPRDHSVLVRARERLEQVSEPFARRRMERALQAGLDGRSLAEVEAAIADEEHLEERRGAHGPERVE
jgi:molecular chaperone HscA